MSGFDNFIGNFLSGEIYIKREECRKNALNDTFVSNGIKIVVDTVVAPDTDKWETGVQKNNGIWEIAEQYKNQQEAGEGHEKWIKLLNDNPNMDLSENEKEFRDKWISDDE